MSNPRTNRNEQVFANRYVSLGWRLSKRGWPDFFCLTPDGDIVLVECKQHQDKLSSAQFDIMRALMLKGLEVRVFREGVLSEPLTITSILDWMPDTYKHHLDGPVNRAGSRKSLTRRSIVK